MKSRLLEILQPSPCNCYVELMDGGMFCMGAPDTCIQTLIKYEEAGIDQVLCFMQFGGIPHQNIMDSIKLFGKDVIPYFRP